MNTKVGLGIAAVFIIVPILIIAGPLLLIWSVNTLFKTGIDYGIWEWVAALILSITFAPKAVKKS